MDAIIALGGIGSAFGLSASAGLNAYIPLLIFALAAKFPLDNPLIELSSPYDILTNWWVIGLLVVLLVIEMLVDKVPAVDSINDVIQTVVRPVAGAFLFAANAQVITDASPLLAVIPGILLAGSVHTTKAAVRPAVTASTLGTGNWAVSILEDVVAVITSLLALIVPIIMMFFMIVVMFFIGRFLWRRRKRKRVAY
ncbi:MAG: DUF4126 domain-containing protein [Anaerolineae bacterium]|nr:DUF4126 domain-containing protein [Anaerolineae bacterium]MCO5194442.1 DUF4126 domain-containing protein [Anaerolineae bacterium]MCO5199347.1 DUF4126 domain-containing protein [Anaerolineae bacterium]MCO5203979.1 DUF4126 domain-containing protein [Anaerolineae bacterium]